MAIIFISITTISVIYFLVALTPLKLCAICSAVSITWLGLLITYLLGLHSEVVLLGILMGGSVVGLMYKLDGYWKKHSLTGTWLLKLCIILFGFLFAYVVINQQWANFLWLIPIIVVIGAVGSMLLKSGQTEQKVVSHLQDKLDHCCD